MFMCGEMCAANQIRFLKFKQFRVFPGLPEMRGGRGGESDMLLLGLALFFSLDTSGSDVLRQAGL